MFQTELGIELILNYMTKTVVSNIICYVTHLRLLFELLWTFLDIIYHIDLNRIILYHNDINCKEKLNIFNLLFLTTRSALNLTVIQWSKTGICEFNENQK